MHFFFALDLGSKAYRGCKKCRAEINRRPGSRPPAHASNAYIYPQCGCALAFVDTSPATRTTSTHGRATREKPRLAEFPQVHLKVIPTHRTGALNDRILCASQVRFSNLSYTYSNNYLETTEPPSRALWCKYRTPFTPHPHRESLRARSAHCQPMPIAHEPDEKDDTPTRTAATPTTRRKYSMYLCYPFHPSPEQLPSPKNPQRLYSRDNYSLTRLYRTRCSGNPLYRMLSFNKVASTHNPLAIPDSYRIPDRMKTHRFLTPVPILIAVPDDDILCPPLGAPLFHILIFGQRQFLIKERLCNAKKLNTLNSPSALQN